MQIMLQAVGTVHIVPSGRQCQLRPEWFHRNVCIHNVNGLIFSFQVFDAEPLPCNQNPCRYPLPLPSERVIHFICSYPCQWITSQRRIHSNRRWSAFPYTAQMSTLSLLAHLVSFVDTSVATSSPAILFHPPPR